MVSREAITEYLLSIIKGAIWLFYCPRFKRMRTKKVLSKFLFRNRFVYCFFNCIIVNFFFFFLKRGWGEGRRMVGLGGGGEGRWILRCNDVIRWNCFLFIWNSRRFLPARFCPYGNRNFKQRRWKLICATTWSVFEKHSHSCLTYLKSLMRTSTRGV